MAAKKHSGVSSGPLNAATWTMSSQEMRYVDDLVKTHLFGENAAEVVQHLLRRGLQTAMRDGFIRRPPGPIPQLHRLP